MCKHLFPQHLKIHLRSVGEFLFTRVCECICEGHTPTDDEPFDVITAVSVSTIIISAQNRRTLAFFGGWKKFL